MRLWTGSQERPHLAQKLVELIVVHPMPGPGDRQCLRVLEIIDTPVSRGWFGPGIQAVNEQGRTGDAGPKAGDRIAGHVVGGPKPDVLIELPAIGSVFVLVD